MKNSDFSIFFNMIMPCFAIQTLQNHDKASGEEAK